jgi:hypothetical protein
MFEVEVWMTTEVCGQWNLTSETKSFQDAESADKFYDLCYEVGMTARKFDLPFEYSHGYDKIYMRENGVIVKGITRKKSLG